MPSRSETMLARNQLTAENFWDRVDKKGPDDCWEWNRSRNNKNYGSLGPKRSNRFGITLAHRLAYFLANGELDESLAFLHFCDNPPCCNPRHLHQGTLRDNAQEMVRRGRWGGPKGENHPLNVLTPEIATDIRWLRAMGATRVDTARCFGISEQTVYKVLRGDTWC